MAGLKPIGSEKLEGMDKLRRIMQIARYNENIPQNVNETTKSEYSIELSDGNTYEIVKERMGYIIKQTINESSNYINPIEDRKYYSSYSQALKRLNLMAKEINTLVENEEETPLIGEQKKKYILKRTKKKVDGETPPVEPIPAPAPVEPIPAPAPVDVAPVDAAPTPVDATPEPMDSDTSLPSPVDADSETSFNMDTEMGGDLPPPPSDDMADDMPPPSDEEVDVDVEEKGKDRGQSDYKRIQILVGKLAQKIRTYEESEELSAKDVKYIINSILSAIDVEVLDEDDIEQIISKLEGEDDEEEGGNDENEFDDKEEDLDMSFSDEDTNPDEEMKEMYSTYGEAFNDYLGSAYSNAMSDDLFEDDDDYDVTDMELTKWDRSPDANARRVAQKDITDFFKKGGDFKGGFNDEMRNMKKYALPYNSEFTFDETFEEEDENYKSRRRGAREINPRFKHFAHGTFGESKVDKLVSKYFTLTESEIKYNYRNIVENEDQLNSVIGYLKNKPNSVYMGKSVKGNLIFKDGLKESKITKSGTIL